MSQWDQGGKFTAGSRTRTEELAENPGNGPDMAGGRCLRWYVREAIHVRPSRAS